MRHSPCRKTLGGAGAWQPTPAFLACRIPWGKLVGYGPCVTRVDTTEVMSTWCCVQTDLCCGIHPVFKCSDFKAVFLVSITFSEWQNYKFRYILCLSAITLHRNSKPLILTNILKIYFNRTCIYKIFHEKRRLKLLKFKSFLIMRKESVYWSAKLFGLEVLCFVPMSWKELKKITVIF